MHKKWRENATGCANRHNASQQSRIRQPRRITTVVVQLAQVLDDSTVMCKLLGFVDVVELSTNLGKTLYTRQDVESLWRRECRLRAETAQQNYEDGMLSN